MPDLMIVLHNQLLFIELKRQKGGKVTEEQKKAIEMINRMGDTTNTVSAYIAYWFEEAKIIINKYLQ